MPGKPPWTASRKPMSSPPDITLHTFPAADSDMDFVFTFERHHVVEQVIRLQAGRAVESADPFIDDWSPAERKTCWPP